MSVIWLKRSYKFFPLKLHKLNNILILSPILSCWRRKKKLQLKTFLLYKVEYSLKKFNNAYSRGIYKMNCISLNALVWFFFCFRWPEGGVMMQEIPPNPLHPGLLAQIPYSILTPSAPPHINFIPLSGPPPSTTAPAQIKPQYHWT